MIAIYKIALLTFLLNIFTYAFSAAQVNTEAMRKQSDKTGWFNYGLATIGINSGNSEFYSVSLLARTDYLFNPVNAFAVGSYEFKSGGGKTLVHKAFGHFRGMYFFSDDFSGEFFLQKEFNEFLKMNDRNLFGLNARMKLFDTSSDSDSSSNMVLFAGAGLMFENENIGTDTRFIRNSVRSTNYANFRWILTNTATVQSVTYYQFNTKRIEDFRFTNETAIEFVITKYLKFLTSLKYRYDSEPPAGVKNYDFELSNGIKVEF